MQRYFAYDKIDNNFLLNDDDWYHIRTVMRMNDYDLVEIVYQKELYIGKINNKIVECIKKVEQKISKKIDVTLIIPLLKEFKMDLILQKSTELGVERIIPFVAERSIIKLDPNKEIKKINRWQKIIKEASEQSKRLDIPVLTGIKTLKELIDIDGIKLVCSTTVKENTIKNVLKNNDKCDKIAILIGPEGGLTTAEEEFLTNNDFIGVTLGDLIMRVETVPIYLLSILNYEKME